MEPQEYAFSLRNIFLGEWPLLFTLEIVLRTVLLYLYTLLMVRLVGKRGMSQFTPFEFVIIIALGSAVGDPMFYADVPLIHGMAVVTTVVGLERLLAVLTMRSPKIEAIVESEPQCVVRDGRIEEQVLGHERLAHDELFMELRHAGVEQLGQVKRAYLEPSGRISLFRFSKEETRPGLSLVPRSAEESPEPLESGAAAPESGDYACWNCGETLSLRQGASFPPCSRCKGEEWSHATMGLLE